MTITEQQKMKRLEADLKGAVQKWTQFKKLWSTEFEETTRLNGIITEYKAGRRPL